MKYYIGIDGGGTKTEFLLTDENQKELAVIRRGSASYKQIGEEGVIRLLQEGILNLLGEAGIGEKAEIYSCFGMPMYGENSKKDIMIESMINARLAQYHIHIVNDVEVGWAGSLELKPGINIVAGTGSIAFGRNEDGISCKAGGWSEFFSDEGSCYWMGKKTAEIFSKEADGRLEKGALYEIIMERFKLENVYDFIPVIEEEYMPFRDKTASLQLLLKEAAVEGDSGAVEAYEEAARELAMIVRALYKKMGQPVDCPVSYSGGLFQTGYLILEPFERALAGLDIVLTPPRRKPVQGAALLAAYYEDRENQEEIKCI